MFQSFNYTGTSPALLLGSLKPLPILSILHVTTIFHLHYPPLDINHNKYRRSLSQSPAARGKWPNHRSSSQLFLPISVPFVGFRVRLPRRSPGEAHFVHSFKNVCPSIPPKPIAKTEIRRRHTFRHPEPTARHDDDEDARRETAVLLSIR